MEPAVFVSLVTLDPDGPETLVAQLYRGIRAAVLEGRLAPGEPLPSSRAASALLGVGRNTVNAAYDLLFAEGVIDVRPDAQPRVVTPDVEKAHGAAVPLRLSDRALAAGATFRA